MGDQVLEEKELSIEAYLEMFAQGSADYEMVKKRSAMISRIIVKKIADASGRLVEDTTFIEKSGVQYTIRTNLS